MRSVNPKRVNYLRKIYFDMWKIAECQFFANCENIFIPLFTGVILTLPEYRLSLQLKIYESIQKDNIEAAQSFLHLHKWINANVRNILDESDAILQANYQVCPLIISKIGKRLPSGKFQYLNDKKLNVRMSLESFIIILAHIYCGQSNAAGWR